MSNIKNYYKSLIDEGKDERHALARTALVFCISPNQVKRQLKRRPSKRPVKPAPKRN